MLLGWQKFIPSLSNISLSTWIWYPIIKQKRTLEVLLNCLPVAELREKRKDGKIQSCYDLSSIQLTLSVGYSRLRPVSKPHPSRLDRIHQGRQNFSLVFSIFQRLREIKNLPYQERTNVKAKTYNDTQTIENSFA